MPPSSWKSLIVNTNVLHGHHFELFVDEGAISLQLAYVWLSVGNGSNQGIELVSEAGALCFFLILYLHVYISIFSPFVLAVAVGSKGAYLDCRVNL